MPVATDLKRTIGFWGGTAIVVGSVVGSGIFRTPSSIAAVLQNPPLILAMWIGTGLLCLCGALTLAELATLLPKTGGTYVYLREAYGDSAAFTFGWLNVVAAIPSGIAALAAFFAELTLRVFGRDPATVPDIVHSVIASSMLVTLSLINIRGAALGAAVQTAFTVIKTAAVAAVIFVAFLFVEGSWPNLAAPPDGDGGDLVGVAAAVGAVFFTYNGWVYVGLVAGEIAEPEKRLQPILVTGVLTIMTLYVLVNVAYFYVFPVSEMVDKLVAQEILELAFGPVGGLVIAACIVASVFGAMNGTILTNSRVAYALARDGLSFSALGRCHRRFATPHVSIAVQGVMAVALVFWLKNFDALISYFVVVEWSALIFTIAAVFVLRRKMADAPRPYRVPAYPWVPLVFVVSTTLGLAAIVWSRIELQGDYAPLTGLGLACLGFPIYYVWRAVTRKRPAS
jgi:amino acid transporter